MLLKSSASQVSGDLDKSFLRKMRQCSVETAGFMDEATNSHSRPELTKTPKESVSGEYCIDYDEDYIKSE